MRMGKKNYQQVYLEKCKCKIKNIKITKFIEAKFIKLNSLESDAELEAKLKSDSDSK